MQLLFEQKKNTFSSSIKARVRETLCTALAVELLPVLSFFHLKSCLTLEILYFPCIFSFTSTPPWVVSSNFSAKKITWNHPCHVYFQTTYFFGEKSRCNNRTQREKKKTPLYMHTGNFSRSSRHITFYNCTRIARCVRKVHVRFETVKNYKKHSSHQPYILPRSVTKLFFPVGSVTLVVRHASSKLCWLLVICMNGMFFRLSFFPYFLFPMMAETAGMYPFLLFLRRLLLSR